MIDTHAHLNFDAFKEDIDEVIARAKSGGVECIIVPGVEPENLNSLLEFAKSRNEIYCAMGIHPHNAKEAGDEELKLVEKNSDEKKVVAIGEIGLDYYYDFATPDEQKKIFSEQIKIAKKRNIPVIVHNREADEDIYNILNEEQDGNLKGVLHCFSSGVDFLEKALNLEFHVSFTGNITFKKVNLDEVVKKAPMERILLETDSPFMTPVPFRGKRNEPSYVKYVAEKIAELKNITIEEVISMTTANAKKLFGLMTLILFFLLTTSALFSQNPDTTESGNEAEGYENPYHKLIGIGPIIGYNTIVEEYETKGRTQNVTYEGLLAYGGTLFFGLLDYLVFDASYIYSINNKISEEPQNIGLIKPYTYNIFELSSNWIVNPYSRVNFFGTLGYTAIFSQINNENKNASYINFGLGILFNLNTNYGLINGLLEVKINQLLSHINTHYPPGSSNEALLTHYFSIPRFGIVFYPKFKF
ncbi:MAG: TatD family deoxyribonuclease [Bacteroidetes bacterium]|nr:MAG: TatD family deoxyribonuclease [Bacteroidota bacterium]